MEDKKLFVILRKLKLVFKKKNLLFYWELVAASENFKHQTFICSVNNRTKLSRGEICVANFIPPANGASLGIFCCFFGPQPQPCRPLFIQIKFFESIHFAKDVLNLFSVHSVQPVLR